MNWRDEKRTLRHDYAARRDEHFVQELTPYSASPKVLETIFFFMVMLLQRNVLEMSRGHLETGTVKLTD